jgi:hypothetical protein
MPQKQQQQTALFPVYTVQTPTAFRQIYTSMILMVLNSKLDP